MLQNEDDCKEIERIEDPDLRFQMKKQREEMQEEQKRANT